MVLGRNLPELCVESLDCVACYCEGQRLRHIWLGFAFELNDYAIDEVGYDIWFHLILLERLLINLRVNLCSLLPSFVWRFAHMIWIDVRWCMVNTPLSMGCPAWVLSSVSRVPLLGVTCYAWKPLIAVRSDAWTVQVCEFYLLLLWFSPWLTPVEWCVRDIWQVSESQ